jgi:DNA-directed RNA polymerase III subunit RPC11
MGVNRFECRVCPYEAPLDREYFEKKEMKQKEVDDVFGGKEEFANADSVASKFDYF